MTLFKHLNTDTYMMTSWSLQRRSILKYQKSRVGKLQSDFCTREGKQKKISILDIILTVSYKHCTSACIVQPSSHTSHMTVTWAHRTLRKWLWWWLFRMHTVIGPEKFSISSAVPFHSVTYKSQKIETWAMNAGTGCNRDSEHCVPNYSTNSALDCGTLSCCILVTYILC